MAIKTPLISDGNLHKPLANPDAISGRAVQLSSDAGNKLTVGSDGGLMMSETAALPSWFDAAFTVGASYPAGTPVPEAGNGWQLAPVQRLLAAGAGTYTKYVSIVSGGVVLQPGKYFGNGVLTEFNVPPNGNHTLYLTSMATDGSNDNNPPRISIGVALQPFPSRDGTYRVLTGPIAFSVAKPSALRLLYTPYGASWNLDSEFQFWVAPL
ncbi:hypothetical protein [Dyella sp.]|uniref:hypothetical protein n=1 Tax=Dyella sp. TaxID=1869338 RepID=UPI002FDA24E4